MYVEIITKTLELNLYGFSGIAVNKDYTGTAFALMDRMWKIVKLNNLENKGLNIWVYERNESVFAAVELNNIPQADTGLEQKTVRLIKYAYHKHIGPYSLIGKAAQAMRDEIQRKGFKIIFPYIEIYGHWNLDETKLETDLLMSVE